MTGTRRVSLVTGGRAPRWRGVGAAVAGAGLLLTGCGSAPELAPATAQQLQDQVLVVSEAVAAGQLDEAGLAASQAREQLEAAVDGGDVSESRYQLIDEALDGVAAEIAAAQAAAAQQAAAEQAAAEQAAAEQAAAEQAAADQAEADRKNGRGNDKKDDD